MSKCINQSRFERYAVQNELLVIVFKTLQYSSYLILMIIVYTLNVIDEMSPHMAK